MKRERAFTLIELLVVVAIIATLIAILIPSLARAKESANRTLCATRLKGQGGSFSIYAAQFNDRLPVFTNTASNWLHDEPREMGDTLVGLQLQASGSSMNNLGATSTLRKWFYCPSSSLAGDSDRAWTDPSSGSVAAGAGTSQNRAFGYQYLNDRVGDGRGLNSGFALPLRTANAQPKLRFRQKLVGEQNSSVAELAFDTICSSTTGGGDFNERLAVSYIPVNTSHLRGKTPSGQNILAFDTHVEWRNFKQGASTPIQIATGAVFWIQNP
jgi:prepilin-type N-terminal cleavage/methylation domain-containing protein